MASRDRFLLLAWCSFFVGAALMLCPLLAARLLGVAIIGSVVLVGFWNIDKTGVIQTNYGRYDRKVNPAAFRRQQWLWACFCIVFLVACLAGAFRGR